MLSAENYRRIRLFFLTRITRITQIKIHEKLKSKSLLWELTYGELKKFVKFVKFLKFV